MDQLGKFSKAETIVNQGFKPHFQASKKANEPAEFEKLVQKSAKEKPPEPLKQRPREPWS